ncbi:MAG: rhodanese-like domain-containing protein [Blastocatellia bacterium]
MSRALVCSVLGALIVWELFTPALASVQTVEDRITIEELKQKMERREKILILDARAGNALLGSRVRIRGARHFTSRDLEKGAETLPRDREIITYCT